MTVGLWGRAALLACAALCVCAATASADAPTGRLLVSYSGASPEAIAQRAGAQIAAAPIPEIHLFAATPPSGTGVAELAERLRRTPGVTAVRRERRREPRLIPNDTALFSPLPGGAPGVVEQWWAAGLDLPGAWDVTSGTRATIAIIDTGVDARHPELADKISRAVDFDQSDGGAGAREDRDGHGTHVASLACAAPNNAYGIAGAGFGCKLMIIKTDLSDASVAASIVYAVKHHADAINMSFGTDAGTARSPEVQRAVEYAYKRDAVMVAAAADEPRTDQGDPANLLQPTGSAPNLNSRKATGIVVTAAAANGQRALFAGRGSQISLAAYGSFGTAVGSGGILGAFPGNVTALESGSFGPPPTPACGCRVTLNGDNRFARLQGTSMATPLVTAVAGSMRAFNPDLSAREIAQILKRTATRTGGWNNDVGWGVMNAGRAMRSAAKTDRRAPRSKISSARVAGAGEVLLKWHGSDKGPTGVRRSGIRYYDVYRAGVDGAAPVRLKRTKRNESLVSGAAGDGFFVVAADKAGNKEKPPRAADAIAR